MDTEEEKKLFEEGSVIITNKRAVINNNQIPLDDIESAFANFDDNWKGALMSFVIGYVSFSGGVWWLGVLMFALSYIIWKNPHDSLVVSTKSGEMKHFRFKENRTYMKRVERELKKITKLNMQIAQETEIENLQKEMDALS